MIIETKYNIGDEESKRYRLHWQEANVAANILITGDKEQKEFGRVRLMYNSLADTTEAGAEWEHKRLVEKACDWLVGNAEDSDESALYLVAKFKQAMEE